jgi:hypothetical protein
VFAVIITILVLDLRVPRVSALADGQLGRVVPAQTNTFEGETVYWLHAVYTPMSAGCPGDAMSAEEPHRDWEFAPYRATPIGRERSFVVRGDVWEVHEATDAISSARVLIFACDKIARRVREFPLNWGELSDEDLWTLSWGR